MKYSSFYLLALALSGLFCSNAFAQSAQESCSDMYPADAYEHEERNQYIQECIQSYGGYDDAPSYEEPAYEEKAQAQEEPAYYDGTVEDYVNNLPEGSGDGAGD